MNVWENTVITDQGIALLTKLMEGNTLEITRAVTGTNYVNAALLREQTEIIDPQQTLKFREIIYPEEGKCCLPCYLTNDELEKGYTARQVGVFATDPDEGEILFFIAQAGTKDNGTIVPSKDESPGYNAEWTFYFHYGPADNVTLMVDPSNVVTVKIMEQYVSEYVAAEILVATIPEIDAVTG